MELTSNNVEAVIKDCLYKEGETPSADYITAKGIMRSFGFKPDKITAHTDDIKSMLDQLPYQFKRESGGGWSAINAVNDNKGNQWGSQQCVDNLICLGLAINAIEYLMPRDLWVVFPGGMPYFVIK